MLFTKPPPATFFGPTSILWNDTFAVLKPLIDISDVTSDKWRYEIRGNTFYSSKMLDAPDLLKHNLFDEAKTEMEWYSFIKKRLQSHKYIVPNDGAVNADRIAQQVVLLENKLDSSKVTSLSLPDTLACLLAGYSANYLMFYHFRMRYYWETMYTGTPHHPGVVYRSRIFVFDKKNRRVFFYNREYRKSNERKLIRKFRKDYLYR
jgi:hypothetical protein